MAACGWRAALATLLWVSPPPHPWLPRPRERFLRPRLSPRQSCICACVWAVPVAKSVSTPESTSCAHTHPTAPASLGTRHPAKGHREGGADRVTRLPSFAGTGP